MIRMLRTPVRNRVRSLQRCAATFVDPFGAKDPMRRIYEDDDLREHNKLTGYSKIIGNPKKGLSDDTSIHPFGDLRINLARFIPSNLCFWWEYDFTGGRILNNGQNALLSNEAKNRLYKLHCSDPDKWTVEALAEEFRIRQQRVLAIIALKEHAAAVMQIPDDKREIYKNPAPPDLRIEVEDKDVVQASEENGQEEKKTRRKISDTDWYNLCDWAERYVFKATADRGAGERHLASVPTFPKFEEIPLEEARKYQNVEWEISRVNRMYTIKEDRFQTREFRERLFLNTGKAGASLDFKTDRTRMHRSPPKHDSPLLVTSLDEDMVYPYVAEPSGEQRRLTPDEFILWKRKNREAFTKLMTKRLAKEKTKEDTQNVQTTN